MATGKRTAKVDTSKFDIKKLEALIKSQCATKTIDINLICPNPHNKNKLGGNYYAALKAQIADPAIGFTQPIMVRDNPDKTSEQKFIIIDGEHRWKAAKELGYTQIPVHYYGTISEAKAKFLMVTQNSIRGYTTDDAIKALLADVQLDMQNDPTMKGIDIWARSVVEEPLAEADKYAVSDEDLGLDKENTTPITLYFNEMELALVRKILGQIRLSKGCTMEQAFMEVVRFFEESTGFGEATGDSTLDSKQEDLLQPRKKKPHKKYEVSV